MDVLKAGFDGLCDFFIRPPRNEYDIEDLGPKDFVIRGKRVIREDFQLTNPRNMTLQCSFYKPQGNPENVKLPCVIYIHGNSGSRMDAIDCVPVLLPNNICLFSFDAAGSGFSEGSYVSLGYYEKFDVQAIVDHLRSTNKISRIALWGRSMGAVTSIMYTALLAPSRVTMYDQAVKSRKGKQEVEVEMESGCQVVGLVLDSPFESLPLLAQEFVVAQKVRIPRFVVSLALKLIAKSIEQKAHFNIEALKPIDVVDKCRIPAVFAHGAEDTLIPSHHSVDLYELYPGEKDLLVFPGNHNSVRPPSFYNAVSLFLYRILLLNYEESDMLIPMPPLVFKPVEDSSFFLCRRGIIVQPDDLSDNLDDQLDSETGDGKFNEPEGLSDGTGSVEDSPSSGRLEEKPKPLREAENENVARTNREIRQAFFEEDKDEEKSFYENASLVVVTISTFGIRVYKPFTSELVNQYPLENVHSWKDKDESFIIRYQLPNDQVAYLIFFCNRGSLMSDAMSKYVRKRLEQQRAGISAANTTASAASAPSSPSSSSSSSSDSASPSSVTAPASASSLPSEPIGSPADVVSPSSSSIPSIDPPSEGDWPDVQPANETL